MLEPRAMVDAPGQRFVACHPSAYRTTVSEAAALLRIPDSAVAEESETMSTFPTITAHTGCDGTRDNSVESAVAGLELGADFVEVDVRADARGALYLSHDEVPSAGAAGARPPAFAELVAAVAPKGGRINLDLKDEESILLVGEAVRAHGLEGRVVVTGCGPAWVHALRDKSPWLPVFLNTDFGGAIPGAGGIDGECRIAVQGGCRGLNIHHRYCSQALVEAAHARGLEVSVWTVSPADDFGRFVDMGVDNITTRNVAELVAFRERRR